jgi:hypothetical protein
VVQDPDNDGGILCTACSPVPPTHRLVPGPHLLAITKLMSRQWDGPSFTANLGDEVPRLADEEITLPGTKSSRVMTLLQLEQAVDSLEAETLDTLKQAWAADMGKQPEDAPALTVQAAICGGVKVEFNPQIKLKQQAESLLWLLMDQLRKDEWWGQELTGILDRIRTTLVLAAQAGVETVFHIDWTEAFNVAFGLGQVCGCGGRIQCNVMGTGCMSNELLIVSILPGTHGLTLC